MCWTPHPENHKDLERFSTNFVDLEELFRRSDYILLAIPSSFMTHGLITKELLDFAKTSAKIINVSRMNIMDNKAFKDSVLQGKFYQSLLDALNSEIDRDIAEAIIPYVTITPHIAGVSEEAQTRIFIEIMNKLSESVPKPY